ncbi:MAG: NADH-quinone oxidoreductase subunit NuoE family protein [Vulcanimicrobiaceae bacterium]
MSDHATGNDLLRPECERIIAQYEEKRSALLPLAHLFQEHEGYVSREALRVIAQMLELTPAVVESTVSFYSLFFRKPVGKYVLQVCRGLSCSINGAPEIMAYLRRKLGIGSLETTEDGLFSYEEVECLAACDRATCMQVNLEFVYSLTPQMIDEMLAAMRAGTYPVAPMARTDSPPRTWKIEPQAQVATGRRTAGATDVPSADDPGGVGDRSGVIMLDRFVDKTAAFRDRTSERLARDPAAVLHVLEEEDAGH